VRILFFGTSTFAIPTLQTLVTHDYEVVAVVTQPDKPAGRGNLLTPPPVKPVAESLGLPILQPVSCRTPEFLDIARTYSPDLSVVVAYGQFLPDPLRTFPTLGTVNLHGSLLPKYRGAAPIQRAIWNGEELTGVSLMWMTREMDAGDVISDVEVPILPVDTYGTLSHTLAERAAELLMTWLLAIASGSAPRTPQRIEDVTFAPIIKKEERNIDWTSSAVEVWRQVRALFPTPIATTTFRNLPVKILDVVPAEIADPNYVIDTAGRAGEVVENNPKVGLFIGTGSGVLQILSLQPSGKRPMTGADFLRGYRVTQGERFA